MRAAPRLDRGSSTRLDGADESGRVPATRLSVFERYYNQIAKPFDWTFTRENLADLLTRIDERERENNVTSHPHAAGSPV